MFQSTLFKHEIVSLAQGLGNSPASALKLLQSCAKPSKYESSFRQMIPYSYLARHFRRVTYQQLTHWGRMTHICVSKLTIICPDNGLSPRRRQAITWSNAGILLIGTLITNFIEVLSEFHTFSFKKMHLKMSSGKWRPFCLGLNVLNYFHI